jgi:AcrR family transcriptional regulator
VSATETLLIVYFVAISAVTGARKAQKMEKENQRTRLTKQLLRNSLIALLQENPISRISIKEICAKAEINRSTFYLHYRNQFDLLDAIEKELLDNVQAHLKNIGIGSDGRQYLVALLSYIEQNADIFRALLCNPQDTTFRQTFVASAFKNMQAYIKLTCPENINDYIQGFLVMGCLDLIQKWVESGFDIPAERLADLMFRLSAGAVRPFSCLK